MTTTPSAATIDARPGRSTVTDVTPDRPGSGNAYVQTSCGHNFHVAAMQPTYRVGDPYDCSTCYMAEWEREHPGLPQAQIATIQAGLPKCPQCGGDIAQIPFIQRTVHNFSVEIDGQTGDILAGSQHYDTLEEEPDWTESHALDQGGRGGKLDVQCADGHAFTTDRLTYRYDYRVGEPVWTVLPAEARP